MNNELINWILLSVNGVIFICLSFFISRLVKGIDKNSEESARLTTVMMLLTQRLDTFEKEHLTELRRRISILEDDCAILGERDHELANAYTKIQALLLDLDEEGLPKLILKKRNRRAVEPGH